MQIIITKNKKVVFSMVARDRSPSYTGFVFGLIQGHWRRQGIDGNWGCQPRVPPDALPVFYRAMRLGLMLGFQGSLEGAQLMNGEHGMKTERVIRQLISTNRRAIDQIALGQPLLNETNLNVYYTAARNQIKTKLEQVDEETRHPPGGSQENSDARFRALEGFITASLNAGVGRGNDGAEVRLANLDAALRQVATEMTRANRETHARRRTAEVARTEAQRQLSERFDSLQANLLDKIAELARNEVTREGHMAEAVLAHLDGQTRETQRVLATAAKLQERAAAQCATLDTSLRQLGRDEAGVGAAAAKIEQLHSEIRLRDVQMANLEKANAEALNLKLAIEKSLDVALTKTKDYETEQRALQSKITGLQESIAQLTQKRLEEQSLKNDTTLTMGRELIASKQRSLETQQLLESTKAQLQAANKRYDDQNAAYRQRSEAHTEELKTLRAQLNSELQSTRAQAEERQRFIEVETLNQKSRLELALQQKNDLEMQLRSIQAVPRADATSQTDTRPKAMDVDVVQGGPPPGPPPDGGAAVGVTVGQLRSLQRELNLAQAQYEAAARLNEKQKADWLTREAQQRAATDNQKAAHDRAIAETRNELGAEIKRLQALLQQQAAELDKLDVKNEAEAALRNEMTAKLRDAADRIAEAEGHVADQLAKVETLEARLREAEEEAAARFDGQADAETDRIIKLAEEGEAARRILEDKIAGLQRLNDEKERARAQAEAKLANAHALFDADAARLRQAIEAGNTAMHKLIDEKAVLEGRTAEQAHQIKTALAERLEENRTSNAALGQLQTENLRLRGDIGQLTTTLSQGNEMANLRLDQMLHYLEQLTLVPASKRGDYLRTLDDQARPVADQAMRMLTLARPKYEKIAADNALALRTADTSAGALLAQNASIAKAEAAVRDTNVAPANIDQAIAQLTTEDKKAALGLPPSLKRTRIEPVSEVLAEPAYPFAAEQTLELRATKQDETTGQVFRLPPIASRETPNDAGLVNASNRVISVAQSRSIDLSPELRAAANATTLMVPPELEASLRLDGARDNTTGHSLGITAIEHYIRGDPSVPPNLRAQSALAAATTSLMNLSTMAAHKLSALREASDSTLVATNTRTLRQMWSQLEKLFPGLISKIFSNPSNMTYDNMCTGVAHILPTLQKMGETPERITYACQLVEQTTQTMTPAFAWSQSEATAQPVDAEAKRRAAALLLDSIAEPAMNQLRQELRAATATVPLRMEDVDDRTALEVKRALLEPKQEPMEHQSRVTDLTHPDYDDDSDMEFYDTGAGHKKGGGGGGGGGGGRTAKLYNMHRYLGGAPNDHQSMQELMHRLLMMHTLQQAPLSTHPAATGTATNPLFSLLSGLGNSPPLSSLGLQPGALGDLNSFNLGLVNNPSPAWQRWWWGVRNIPKYIMYGDKVLNVHYEVQPGTKFLLPAQDRGLTRFVGPAADKMQKINEPIIHPPRPVAVANTGPRS